MKPSLFAIVIAIATLTACSSPPPDTGEIASGLTSHVLDTDPLNAGAPAGGWAFTAGSAGVTDYCLPSPPAGSHIRACSGGNDTNDKVSPVAGTSLPLWLDLPRFSQAFPTNYANNQFVSGVTMRFNCIMPASGKRFFTVDVISNAGVEITSETSCENLVGGEQYRAVSFPSSRWAHPLTRELLDQLLEFRVTVSQPTGPSMDVYSFEYTIVSYENP